MTPSAGRAPTTGLAFTPGVVAAGYAGAHTVTGLLLYAWYPNTDLSRDADLQVEPISASNDGLTTSADIARTRHLVPPDTEFTVIDGGRMPPSATSAGNRVTVSRPSAGSSHWPRSLPPPCFPRRCATGPARVSDR